MPTPATVPEWGTIRQAALRFSLSTDTIRRMIARGELYAERIGPRLIRVDLGSLKGQPVAWQREQ